MEEVEALEEFLRDPWRVRADGGSAVATVQVLVPRVVTQPAPPPWAEDGGGGGREEAKRLAMQRQAAAASLAAEDYVRRLETGGAAVSALLSRPSWIDFSWDFKALVAASNFF